MENTKLIESLITHIPVTRKYWLVRTQGGLFYDDFKYENYIAVGYNPITLEEVSESKSRIPKHPENFLSTIIKGKIQDEKQPKYAANQLLKFVYGIKKGDIVLIPSENSKVISIGEVTDSMVYLDIDAPNRITPKGGSKKCPFVKRKPVKWIKEVKRSQLDPLLYKLLFSHHFISDGSAYDNIIDNMLHDLYIKGSQTFLVLDVATQRDISARTLFGAGSGLLNLVDEITSSLNLQVDTSEIDVKLTLRSPGNIQLTGKQATAILIAGLVILFLNGGGLKVEFLGLDINTNGIIKNVNKFLNDKHKRDMRTQILNQNIKSLKMKSPEDLQKIMGALEIKENDSEEDDVKKD